MARFGVSEQQIAQAARRRLARLMRFQIERTRALMQPARRSGAPARAHRAGDPRHGQGGLRMLDKLGAVRCDVFRRRPVLQWYDWPLLLWRAL